MVVGVVFILSLRSKKIPASLVLLGLGVLVGMFWSSFSGLSNIRFGINLPPVAVPSLADLSTALIVLVIPQISLTIGNAVFGTVDTANTYFGPQAKKVTPKALLTTMGVVNIGAGLLGGMPICHGSGGLTAHFRLGARTGGAPLLIGVLFLAMGLFLDGNVVPIFALIPYAVLGVLVIFVGVQHALLIRDLRGKREILVVLAIAIPGLLTASLAIGFASGMFLHLVFMALSGKQSIWPQYLSPIKRKPRRSQDTPDQGISISSPNESHT